MTAMNGAKRIDADLLPLLSAMEFAGTIGRLPGSDDPRNFMGRATYGRINKVLEALGGRWDRRVKGHVFGDEAEGTILDAVTAGAYVNRKQLLQFFETPAALAREVVEWAEIGPGMMVLEPSAGLGALARPARDAGGFVVPVEIDVNRFDRLVAEFGGGAREDFLLMPLRETFDRVVMNPPFSNSQDIAHVRHAYDCLKPGGILVAIMATGWTFRRDRKATEFREWLERLEHETREIPEGAFQVSGTDVHTVMVRIER